MSEIFIVLTGNLDTKFLRVGKLISILNKKQDTSKDIIIFSGLSSLNPKQKVSEAKTYKSYFNKHFKEKIKKILLEEESMDTLGNALFTKKIIDKLLQNKEIEKNSKIIIISEHYHIKRVEWTFKQIYSNSYNIEFKSAKTHLLSLFFYYLFFILIIILSPIIYLFSFYKKNVYLKDMIILKILKKDFKTQKISSRNISDFITSFSLYSKKENSSKYRKSIYKTTVEFAKKE